MAQNTAPQPAAEERITGPLRVLLESGASSREIARELHISQTTAIRRKREYRSAIRAATRRNVLVGGLCVLAAITFIVLTAAVATIAWG